MKTFLNSLTALALILLCINGLTGCCDDSCKSPETNSTTARKKYEQLQLDLAKGWNTWDTRSVLTHVFLPFGSAVDINLIDRNGNRENTFLIGERSSKGEEVPKLHPGAHSYDGAYTDITVEWSGLHLRVQSAADGLKNVILITPLDDNAKGGKIAIVPKSLWYRSGRTSVKDNTFRLSPPEFRPNPEDTKSYSFNSIVKGDYLETINKFDRKMGDSTSGEIILSANSPVVVCIDCDLDFAEAEKFIKTHSDAFVEVNKQKFGEYYEVYNAMQNVTAWDNIFDPTINRVITPVSRIWNVDWSSNPALGGFVLFCWDTYFASMMLSTGSRELAYANAVEITDAVTENGFVPNFYAVNNYKSRDRSQPPVGSLAVWTIYQKYQEKWFLELVYDKLLGWNRWWDNTRKADGLLCWGSSPYERVTYQYWENYKVNNTEGGALESGLDNSQMYDSVPYDKEKHHQKLNDVGLSSLYIMDCNLLAKIASELGKSADARELKSRAKEYTKNMAKTWDEKRGFYYNRFYENDSLNLRISPTNFYPLLANVPTQAQAERMINEHFFNPDEFWGEWILPATPRTDPAYKDNNYWRGRIWAPLNFLVYMGLRNYDLTDARKALSEKSKNLILKGWLSNGYVFENYSAETGQGDDVTNSDKFYHWGALLSLITLMEEGYY